MDEQRDNNKIGVDAIFLSVYFALTPIHQALLLSNGSTINKYLAFVSIIAVVLVSTYRYKTFRLNLYVVRSLGGLACLFASSILWSYSISQTIQTLISICSYFILMIIVCSKEWSDREKVLFKIAVIMSCTYFGYLLFQNSAVVRRATFTWAATGKNVDQNMISCNIGFGILFSLDLWEKSKNLLAKILYLSMITVMLVGIICAGSRGAVICIAIAAVYLLNTKFKDAGKSRIAIFVLVGLVALLMYLVTSKNILGNEWVAQRYSSENVTDMTGRMNIWRKWLEVLIHRPLGLLMGYGYGGYQHAYMSYYGQSWSIVTHNDILYIIMNAGVFGLVFVVRFVKNIWNEARYQNHILGLACILFAILCGLDIDYFSAYGWWNAMIFAYIGIGVRENER